MGGPWGQPRLGCSYPIVVVPRCSGAGHGGHHDVVDGAVRRCYGLGHRLGSDGHYHDGGGMAEQDGRVTGVTLCHRHNPQWWRWWWLRLSPFSIKPLLSVALLAAVVVASPMANIGLSYTYTPSKMRFLSTVLQFPHCGHGGGFSNG